MFVCIQLYVNIILVLATMHMAYARGMDTGKVRRYLLDSSAVVQKTSCHLQLSFLVPTSLYTGRALRTVVVILNQAISCLRQYFFLLRNCCLSVTNCNVVVIRRYYHVEVTMILTAIAYVALLLCILRARRVRAVVLLYAYSRVCILASIRARIMFIHFVCLLWIPAVL